MDHRWLPNQVGAHREGLHVGVAAHPRGIIHPGRRPLRDSIDGGQSRVRTVIESAFRRRSLVLTVEHSAFAVAAMGGGATLMLLLGTDILNWLSLVLLAAAGLTITYIRLRKGISSRYRVAQIVDKRLHLSDSLSTAWFLLEDSAQRENMLAKAQIRSAEQAVRGVDNALVFPFVWKRTWALAAALIAVASGLFVLRYLVTSSLDLTRPLIPVPFSSMAEVLERIEKLTHRDSTLKQAGVKGDQQGLRRGAGPEQNEKRGQRARTPGQLSNGAGAASGDKSSQQLGASPNTEKKDSASLERSKESGAPSANTTPQRDAAVNSGRPSQGDQTEDRDARNNEAHQPASGLLDRMKDALSGLMAKMRPQDGAPRNVERQRDSRPGEQSAENNGQNEQMQQEERSSQENQANGREQSTQSQPGAEASEKSAGTRGHSSEDGTKRKGSDAQSGIGRQDGEKSLKEADQLRAMGKLDEIIGKRSANLTGDVTMETQSSHQQLQTQYSGRVARHSDAGGEIDRDQVPVALQKYVREYMEQVRKQAKDDK